MLRALMTAVTGVRAHQTMLDVTGNNIANANTTGFKKDFTIFADLMYQANKYASGAGDTRGGINPAQVGLGVSVSAIETIHTQGSASYTGNPSDMMIQDNGFFVYKNGDTSLYSRAGAAVLDVNQDLVQAGTGYYMQGYKISEDPLDPSSYVRDSSLSNINIPLGKKLEAKATSEVMYQCNLDSRSRAYLPYGFADLPFNAYCGWDNGTESNEIGTAWVTMNGTRYEMSFQTDLDLTTTEIANGETGRAYLTIDMSNGGKDTFLAFDMTGISGNTGKPSLNLPRITADVDNDGNITGYTYPTNADSLNIDDNNRLGFVGFLTNTGTLVTESTTLTAGEYSRDVIATWTPIYQFPGSTPPTYFTAEYNDTTGVLKIRDLTFFGTDNDGNTGEISNFDIDNAATYEALTIRANPTLFTYNMKDNMNYTSFSLSGAVTVDTTGNGAVAQQVSYDIIAEFDESVVTRGGPSELAKTVSSLTLWYYGLSNADDGNADAIPAMHQMKANVYFNADGTFDSIEWQDTDNDNAPLGFRILNDANGDANFRIQPNNTETTTSTTLLIQQAQNLDEPGQTWDTVQRINEGGYHQTKETIYDCEGNEHTLEVNFKKITENRWRWEAFLLNDDGTTSSITPQPSSGEIEFCGCGPICNAVTSDNDRRGNNSDAYPNAEVEINIPFSLLGTANSKIKLNFGGDGDTMMGVTQFASETTTKPIYQDGYKMGVLENYSIGKDGTITGAYSNGKNIPMYRVALATFANQQGLEKVGDTMFRETVNSGVANIDPAGVNGKGSIMAQNLEMSNVDLTEEFTHLIIAQRGFQANTRVITTSDQVLEEVVNLKR